MDTATLLKALGTDAPLETQAERVSALKRLLPATGSDLADAYPGWWSGDPSSATMRRRSRDLARAGAVRGADGYWRIACP